MNKVTLELTFEELHALTKAQESRRSMLRNRIVIAQQNNPRDQQTINQLKDDESAAHLLLLKLLEGFCEPKSKEPK
jgi:hypothetical protein